MYNDAIDSGKNYLDNKLEQYNNCTSNFCRGFVSGEFGGEVATSTGLLIASSEATVGKTLSKSANNLAEGVGKNTAKVENVSPSAFGGMPETDAIRYDGWWKHQEAINSGVTDMPSIYDNWYKPNTSAYGYKATAKDMNYPQHGGAIPNTQTITTLEPGTVVGRYGRPQKRHCVYYRNWRSS